MLQPAAENSTIPAMGTADWSRSWWVLAGIVAVFLMIRLPLMYRQVGGQDEDCYAVPGLTICTSGIPRLPHVPARNPESVYFRADEALFSEPPLSFYVQAAFYSVLPHQHGTARLASAVIGIGLLILVYRLAVTVTQSPAAALWGAGLLSLSKCFYFPATTARPDILCAALSLAAVSCTLEGLRSDRTRWFVLAGVCLGFAGLSHQFAIVAAVQLAVWTLVASRGRQRVIRPLILAGVSLAVACLWLPLILRYPEAFFVQTQNQLHNPNGGSMWLRALWPWRSIGYHASMMWTHCTPWQFSLAFAGLAAATVAAIRSRSQSELLTIAVLAWSGLYLISVLVGWHHPVNGYFVYPAALMAVTVGWSIDELLKRCGRFRWGLGVLLVLAMLPGLGLRTLAAHLQHWGEIHYDAPRFARQLIDRFPADAVVAVDTPFTLDFVVAGRETRLATTLPLFFRLDTVPFDYLVVCQPGRDTKVAAELGCELEAIVGTDDDPFACVAEIWRPTAATVQLRTAASSSAAPAAGP